MKASVVFLNGEVITVDGENRVVEAVAVDKNRIVAVGTNNEIQSLITDETNVIDLKGKSLLPGFVDPHLHLTSYGTEKLGVRCKQPHITSIEDLLTELRVKALATPKGEWVRAWGFIETKMAERRYPTKEELDHISTEHPILIVRACNHISVANSMALELANIDKNTPNPKGGIIERNNNGELTGRLLETAHFLKMMKAAKFSEAELKMAMAIASDDYIAAGITSVHEAGVYDDDTFRIMQQGARTGLIRVRVYAMAITINDPEEFLQSIIKAGISTGVGDERFKIGPAKVFIDGSSSGRTIATRRPHTSAPGDYGILNYSQEELDRILIEAHKKGFQITAHAQGDRAIEMMLNCIEKALKEHPRENHRHRIEHAGITEPDLLERMVELGVVPIPNPHFFYEFGDGYIINYGERVNHMYPLRQFIDNGVIAAIASDSPVTDYRPLFGIHVAVNRESAAGQKVGENQRIGVMEAIRMYTWNGAYASFEENIKGSIEVGKLADLVVIDGSILQTDERKIKDLSVDLTMLDGEIVYQNSSIPVR